MSDRSEKQNKPRSRGRRRRRGSKGLFRWLPWEKLTIWALFLFLVWALREFFSVIFLTFIFSYIMTSIVRSFMNVFSPNRERPWLHRIFVVFAFALLLGSLYGLVAFLKEPFREQINQLRIQFNALELHPQTIWDDLARNTIGKFRYDGMYRGPEGEERRQEDLEAYESQEFHGAELDRFRGFQERREAGFRNMYVKEKGQEKFDEFVSSKTRDAERRAWIISQIAPDKYLEDAQNWNRRYVEWYGEKYGTNTQTEPPAPSLPEHQSDPEEFKKARQGWVYDRIYKDEIDVDKEASAELDEQFRKYLGQRAYRDLEQTPVEFENEFRAYYEKLMEFAEDGYPFEQFIALRTALESGGEDEFEQVLLGDIDQEERQLEIERSFRRTKQTELANETLDAWKFLRLDDLRVKFQEFLPSLANKTVGFGFDVFQFISYFALSLMLSFFITFDLPRIKRGIVRLGESRAADFYHEIAPGLVAFGTLIGRAFQAQGVIAICNTLLTLGLIKMIGLPYEIFLCTIVFFCSFIPVLGVVLSTIPIALIALPMGTKAVLLAVGGVLLIHFIETSVLNPKILGEMLHLHPVLVLGILVIGEHFFHVWGLLLGVPVMVYIIHYVILNEEPNFGPLKTPPPGSTGGPPVDREDASGEHDEGEKPEHRTRRRRKSKSGGDETPAASPTDPVGAGTS